MRTSLITVFLLPLLSSGYTEPPAPRTGNKDAQELASRLQKMAPRAIPLGCVIRSDPTCVLGSAPKVTVTLINQTNSDVYLVGSLDGSECRWRYPYCYFELTGPDGKLNDYPGGSRCGYMNALREKDFVKVPSGGKFDP